MAFPRLGHALVLIACAAGALLAACGGGTVASQFKPNRAIVFGDGLADLGQTGNRFTINGTTSNVWPLQAAARYGIEVKAQAQGGTGYATGNARIVAKPDAAGATATLTVTEQISRFLTTGTFVATDLILVSAGTSDIVTQAQSAFTGGQSQAQALTNIAQAGRDLGAQVRRLVNAGAKNIGVLGVYNLGRSPWATAAGQASFLQQASSRFNDELVVSIVDLGANVLYVDASFYYNLVTSSPGSYGFTDATSLACTSVDPGAGIGIGAGQVSSARCTASTLVSGTDGSIYVFADRIYPTPVAHQLLGDYAYDRISNRW